MYELYKCQAVLLNKKDSSVTYMFVPIPGFVIDQGSRFIKRESMLNYRIIKLIVCLVTFCPLFSEIDYSHYQSPFTQRYVSEEMSYLFSLQNKHATWRQIWVALAECEKDLGLNISQEQIDELKAHIHTIDFQKADEYEREVKHDVMAHIHAYGDDCPLAKPIIHLGATSCTIADNADLIIMRNALRLIRKKLVVVLENLAKKAEENKKLSCLSYTHFQAAQPTTVGKRMCLWLQDLFMDLKEIDHRFDEYYFLGINGATGTQASFLELFHDPAKVRQINDQFVKKLGAEKVFLISGQTYTRKQDMLILEVLSGIAVSAHKMSTDLRLLAHEKEIEEPFGENQVGSSAMPYKRNPMLNERVCSLSRYVLSLIENTNYTASTQWLERTLDDSANRRLCIPEAFLATDTLLEILTDISKNMVIYPRMIQKNLDEELPFMAIKYTVEMAKKVRDIKVPVKNLKLEIRARPNYLALTVYEENVMEYNESQRFQLMEYLLLVRQLIMAYGTPCEIEGIASKND